MAATSIATSVMTMIIWSFGFLRMGTVGLVAQAFGRSDYREIVKTLLRNFIIRLKVLKRLEESNIRNFTIYYSAKLHLLFSHLEYVGDDYAADQRAIAEHEDTRKWWKIMEDFQVSVY